jgi:DNA-binding response OmpR family regulator
MLLDTHHNPILAGHALAQGMPVNSPHTETNNDDAVPSTVLPFILFVDDDLDALDVLSWFARRWDFQTVGASSGREALSIAAHKHPDIIVLDVMMPDMNGFDVLDALKADMRTSHIPVIILTAGAVDEGFKAQGKAKGACEYLIKPVNPYELMSRINYHLRRHTLDKDTTLVASTQLEDGDSDPTSILIVDDDLNVLEVLETALEEQHRSILVARNAFEALSILRECAGKISLLITDLHMPEMTGVALIKRCMLLYPEMGLVAISGAASQFQRELDRLPSPVTILDKPLDLTNLRTTVCRLLERKSIFTGG